MDAHLAESFLFAERENHFGTLDVLSCTLMEMVAELRRRGRVVFDMEQLALTDASAIVFSGLSVVPLCVTSTLYCTFTYLCNLPQF